MPKILKRVLVNVFLKRGASKTEEFIGKKIRHGMTTLGGILMTAGYLQPEDVNLWEMVIGGAVALGGVVLSDVRLWVQDKLSK